VDVLLTAHLQIIVKAWPGSLDLVLFFATVEKVEPRRYFRRAPGQRANDIGGQMARAREYRLQECTRNFPLFYFRISENKKAVGTGGKSSLDGEEIA